MPLPPKFRRAASLVLIPALLASLAWWVAPWFMPLPKNLLQSPNGSGLILDRHGIPLARLTLPDSTRSLPVGFSDLPQTIIDCTLAAEDKRFFSHGGVDLLATVRATKDLIAHREIISGASTITQQLIKISSTPARRTPLTKIRESLTARHLEMKWSKEEILTAYFNRLDYGNRRIGIAEAARFHFQKPLADLSLAEAALLAGLPQSPSRLNPLRHPQRAIKRRDTVLQRLAAEKKYDATNIRNALAEPLALRPLRENQNAPWIRSFSRPQSNETATRCTIDATLQNDFEKIVSEETAKLKDANLRPGSTLKPFTYALAMQKGLLYPSERLLDDTLDFGAYSPANFDGIYNGLIAAGEALQLSLNVPAVALLQRVGIQPMYRLLQQAGFSTLTESPDHYGLGLTLGNCGVRLDELAAAYTMLANLGQYRPLRTLDADADAPSVPRQIFEPGIALAVQHMLEHPFPRENQKQFIGSSGVRTRVCWKTGTSTGFHDAWCVAFNAQYVVAVWVGNSDGRASQRLVGATAALPLTASVFRALPPRNTPDLPELPNAEHTVDICAISGLPVTDWCQRREATRMPKALFLNRRCDVHHPAVHGEHIVERWPGDARQWDLARIINPVAVGPGDTGAPADRTQELRILAPVAGSQFIHTGEPGGDRVLLQSSLDGLAPVHWYLDGQFLGTSDGETPLYLDLAVGAHTLSCLASDGTTDTLHFEVLPAGDLGLARAS